MNLPQYLILLLTVIFSAFIQKINAALEIQYSIINCTWPCPDNDDSCVITSNSTSCQKADDNSWVMSSPKKAPAYTGATVSIDLLPCISAPIPQLPVAKDDANLTDEQTIIKWPVPNLRRPLDNYLGNCGHGLYCSSSGEDSQTPVCRPKLEVGSPCTSSNQCSAGYCYDNICHPKNEDISTARNETHSHTTTNVNSNSHSSGEWSDNANSSMSATTVKILASVFGILGGLAIIVFGFIMWHRYRRRKVDNNLQATDNFLRHESQDKEEQFATDFLSENPHRTVDSYNGISPSTQQSQLQTDLRNYHEYLLNQPPPSYRP
ncbi:MAG: hypothetical protein EXX96DRAFT_649648 [Benjaminiella poitrasii]|nr:MAG: hypothetical protein EXX96DRAFT_649648 [Benjaminiella poitrasii]